MLNHVSMAYYSTELIPKAGSLPPIRLNTEQDPKSNLPTCAFSFPSTTTYGSMLSSVAPLVCEALNTTLCGCVELCLDSCCH